MVNNVTVDFTTNIVTTDPLGVGFVVSEFGGNPIPLVGDTTWNSKLANLAPGHIRCSVAWYGGSPGYGAGGSSRQHGTATAMINAIKAMGAIPLVSFNGDSADNNFVPADGGSLVHYFNDAGGQNGGPVHYFSIGNEAENGGTPSVTTYESGSGTGSATATLAAMHAADATINIGMPAAAYWDTAMLSWAGAQTGIGCLSYHAYDGGDAGTGFPNDGQMYTHIKTDLPAYKAGILYGCEECNWHFQYGGANTTQFYDWHNCCNIADNCGQALSAGGHLTVYSDFGTALGLLNDGTGANGQPGAKYTTFPAYWGLGIWTGMNGQFKRYSGHMVSCTNTLGVATLGAYACDNGKLVIINKSTSVQALTIGVTMAAGATSSTYNIWSTSQSSPLAAITQVVTNATFTGGVINYTIPAGTAISIDINLPGSSGGGTTAPSWDPSGNYTLIFDDEFNGTSLDTTKWQAGWFGTGITGPINSAETAKYSSANATVSGGSLNLLMTNTSSDGGVHPNTGAAVSSNPHDGRASGGFEFTYGSVEWRAYLPPSGTTIANWPALWMDGQNWPTTGEFDIMEGLSGTAQWHIPTNTGNPGGGGPGTYYGWHQFGVKWLSNGSVTFYYDGVAVSSGLTAPNTAPMYLIMNNTQGSFGGTGVFPATMLVDWVRVWQPGGGGGGGVTLPLKNNFEEGANGTAISVTNSAGTGQNAFDTVSVSNGSAGAYSTSVAAHGTLSALFVTPPAGGVANVHWNTSLGQQTTLYGRANIYLTAYPGANDAVIQFQNAGAWGGGIQIAVNGQIILQSNTYVQTNSVSVIPLNTWVRIEWQVVCGAAGAASLTVRYYNVLDSTTITEIITDVTNAYGSGATPVVGDVGFGWNSNHPSQPNMFMDDLQVSNTGWIGPAGSILLLTNNFEEGTNATAITTGNSGGVGENAFDFVNATNAAVANYSSTQAAHGTLSGQFSTSTTAGQGDVGWTSSFNGTYTTFNGRVYIYLTAYPAAQDSIVQIRGSGGSSAGGIQIDTTGHIVAQTPAFATAFTFTNAIPLNTWYRIAWAMTAGAAGAAYFAVSTYVGDSPGAFESHSDNTSAWGGTGGVGEVDFGWTNAHVSQPIMYLDDIQVNNYFSEGPVGGNPPAVVTQAATNVAATSVTLNGTVNPNGQAATYQFEYGTTTSYGTTFPTSAPSVGAGNAAVSASANISGLLPNTTYHYRIDGANAAGTTLGGDLTFTTGASVPVVSTGQATNVSYINATLNGTVNPEGQTTNYQFQYGLTTGYGFVVPSSPTLVGSGGNPVPVSSFISGLSPNTTYHFRLTATNGSGTTNDVDQTFTTTSVPLSAFPANPIGLLVQILVNGSWIDITGYIYNRTDLIISGRGRPNETQSASPVSMTLTLNNIGGTFSPNNTASPFYPNIQQNTQIRVLVSSQSVNGVQYSGYRFWGEVRKWPPSWDVTGSDVYVNITAGGLLTRYIQGSNLGSALKRFYSRKEDATDPIAYWTCEELNGASQFSNVESASGNIMTWTGTPSLSSDSALGGSDPLPQLNGSKWTGNTGSYSFSGPVVFSQPGTYQFTAPGGVTNLTTVSVIGAGGGGANGGNGNSGGGGESASATNVALTPGKKYTVIVGRGGDGAPASNSGFFAGKDGGFSSFTGDSVTVTANGGKGGPGSGTGLGGTGSTAPTHFNGGNGAAGGAGGGGGGGGSSAGTSAAGANGSAGNPSGVYGAGGTAPTGGGNGGHGQTSVIRHDRATSPQPGFAPGGGGGGGSWNAGFTPLTRGPGAPGAPGRVTLNFVSSTTPQDVIVRYVINVPKSGMPNGAVIVRAYIASGTLAGGYIESYYSTTGNGSIGFRGFTSSGVKVADTGLNATAVNVAGPFMVSMELTTNGSFVNYTMAWVKPNTQTWNGAQGSFTGTIGACNQIVVNPNGNIQDTTVGQIVLQYAWESLLDVGPSLGGYNGELAVDRFFRLCTEEGFKGIIVGDGYWPFEDGTIQGWTGTNGASVSNTSLIASTGNNCLLMTIAANSNGDTVSSPNSTPCNPGQYVSAYADIQPLPGLATNQVVFLKINFFNSVGTPISSVNQTPVSVWPGSWTTLSVIGAVAPANTAFVGTAMTVSGFNPSLNYIVVDNATIAIGSRMGPQPDKTFVELIQEVEDIDRGLIVEARDFYGLKYRNRVSLQNQSVAVTLDYTAGTIADTLQPVFDEMLVRNNISITRQNGSTFVSTLNTGSLSMNAPPNGIGNYPFSLTVNCFSDTQIANIAVWILTVGTVNDYRYPSIPVNMARLAVANIFAAVPALDCGDRIQVINAPTDRLPSATIDQLAFGFDETINTFKWLINPQCVPESEFTGSGFPTW